jgi:ribosomal protein L7/L12
MGTAIAVAVGLLVVAAGIVLVLRRRERGTELIVTHAASPPHRQGRLDETTLEREVVALLERRQKIHAIKLVREQTGIGLKEAKDAVEAIDRTGRLHLPHRPKPMPLAGDEVLAHARRLKAAGRAIEAIKLIRQHSGLGLKDAKDMYDRL